MECPTDDPDVTEKFEEMTAAASKAHESEQTAKGKVEEVSEKEKVLLKCVKDGLELTSEGIAEYRKLVQDAFKEAKDAKASYQMYGTTCLNTMGLGRKLKLVKFESKMSTENIKCKFCEKGFQQFAILSEHMIRVHHGEFESDVMSSTTVESSSSANKSGNADEQYYKYPCDKCNKRFNNESGCTAHKKLCSGVENKPLCPTCGKTFVSKKAYRKHKPCKGVSK